MPEHIIRTHNEELQILMNSADLHISLLGWGNAGVCPVEFFRVDSSEIFERHKQLKHSRVIGLSVF